MSYIVSVDNEIFRSLSFERDTVASYNVSMSYFPPSFVNYLNNINLNLQQNSPSEALNYENIQELSSYRYLQSHQNFPTVYNLNYTLKKSSDFFDYFNQSTAYSIQNENINEIYPIAVRYTNGKNLWVIERPPFQATVTYRQTRSYSSSKKEKVFNIWMPWTVMVLNIDFSISSYDAFLLFNDKPLESLNDPLIPCFYPNIYGDGRMCLNQTSIGLQQHLASTQSFDIATVYNYIINDYMSGGWNLDLGSHNYDAYLSTSNKEKYPFLYDLRSTVLFGNKNLKVRAPSNNITLSRKIGASLSHLSSIGPEEMLKVVSESIALSSHYSRTRTLSAILPSLSQPNDLLSNFSQFFHSFSKQVSSYFRSNLVLAHSSDFDYIYRYGSNGVELDKEVYSKNLLKVLSAFYQQYDFDIFKEDFYSNTIDKTSNPLIYVRSIDDISIVSLSDTDFNYIKESANV